MEKTTFYVQLEVQIDAQGNKGVIPMVYDTETEALAKHYAVLGVAAVSAIPYHASFILQDSNVLVDGRVFDRRTVETTESEG